MLALFLAGVFVVALILDLGLMSWNRRRLERKGLHPKAGESRAFIFGRHSPLLARVYSFSPAFEALDQKLFSGRRARTKVDLRSHLAAWTLPSLELALGIGGDLQVTCSNTRLGVLLLQENSYLLPQPGGAYCRKAFSAE